MNSKTLFVLCLLVVFVFHAPCRVAAFDVADPMSQRRAAEVGMRCGSVSQAEIEFERACEDPDNLAIELEDIDINEILKRNYVCDKTVVFDRRMMWRAEKKKAWNQVMYTSGAVESAILDVINANMFVRLSKREMFANPNIFDDVVEDVYINDKNMIVTLLGRADQQNGFRENVGNHKNRVVYYAQHGVVGSDERPLNTLRIVFIVGNNDELRRKFTEVFERVSSERKAGKSLPSYFERYMQRDLHVMVSRKRNI